MKWPILGIGLIILVTLGLTPNQSKSGGKIAFHSNRDGEFGIYLINSDGTGLRKISGSPSGDFNPSFSPDGKRVAFERGGDIWVMEADGSNQVNLTNTPSIREECPSFSGDGKKVAFGSDEGGRMGVYIINLDGTGRKRLTDIDSDASCPSFSGDGRWIAYNTDRDGTMEIYIMKTDGSGKIRLTANSGNNMDPAFSFDSKRIAFSSNREGRLGIYLMNRDGSDQRRLTRGQLHDIQPAFSRDGTMVAFERGWDIFVISSNGGIEVNLTRNPAFKNGGPSFGP